MRFLEARENIEVVAADVLGQHQCLAATAEAVR
jgi:hypothetical protein